MIVIDASAAVSALLNDGQARRLLAVESIHVPHLVDAELVSVLRRQVAAGLLASGQAHRALNVWRRLGLIRYARIPSPGTRLGTSVRCNGVRRDVCRPCGELGLRSDYWGQAAVGGERTPVRNHRRTAVSVGRTVQGWR